jgi:hypothetical protein
VRFLRHLAAVCLVVAAAAGLGLAWDHFGYGTLGGARLPPGTRLSETAGSPQPGRVVLPKGTRLDPPPGAVVIRSGSFDLGLSSMLQPVNLPYLRHTVVIETGVIAAVVIIDATRRRSRRASRAAQLAPARDSDNLNEQHE